MTLFIERPTAPNQEQQKYDPTADSEGLPAPHEFDPTSVRAIGAKVMEGFRVFEGPISQANLLNHETGFRDFPHV